MSNAWIGIQHRLKSLGFYLPIQTGNVLLKFGFDIQSQTEVRVRKLKTQYGNQAAILKVTCLKIDRLLSIYTDNVLPKLGLNIQRQTKVTVRKLKNPIWQPGGHFGSDISDNQQALAHGHKQHAYEI